MSKFKVVILAAGLGKRMNNHSLPKALTPLKGKPLIAYLLEAVAKSDLATKPVIIVGKLAEQVQQTLGPDYIYVLQSPQLGTGHALMVARPVLENQAENILVLYSDQPLVSSATIRKIVAVHLASQTVITMGTVTVNDFADWREGYYDFGRIVRDYNGNVQSIVEKKDATAEMLEIKELNPSYFCFKASWLWSNLDDLGNHNVQGEYYLTDLIKIARSQGEPISTVAIDPKEALGVNNEAQLTLIEELL
ncbi:MAG: NTP transferase domain-containing protein [Patescibacteria group bacterium]|jgi:bifunctional UDP-N-acetylglucosamine pyrophosphorylase/glucosamine-1-phosphate N-acetyltransferase|nr:NTP transferase domain-containing protein [Patescibacteria group bacterium]